MRPSTPAGDIIIVPSSSVLSLSGSDYGPHSQALLSPALNGVAHQGSAGSITLQWVLIPGKGELV